MRGRAGKLLYSSGRYDLTWANVARGERRNTTDGYPGAWLPTLRDEDWGQTAI